MNYDSIDSLLQDWAKSHQLHLATEYKDEPVRSVDVVDRTGAKIQIWVDPPANDGSLRVHVWDYRRRREDLPAASHDLPMVLERAYQLAQNWLSASRPA